MILKNFDLDIHLFDYAKHSCSVQMIGSRFQGMNVFGEVMLHALEDTSVERLRSLLILLHCRSILNCICQMSEAEDLWWGRGIVIEGPCSGRGEEVVNGRNSVSQGCFDVGGTVEVRICFDDRDEGSQLIKGGTHADCVNVIPFECSQ